MVDQAPRGTAAGPGSPSRRTSMATRRPPSRSSDRASGRAASRAGAPASAIWPGPPRHIRAVRRILRQIAPYCGLPLWERPPLYRGRDGRAQPKIARVSLIRDVLARRGPIPYKPRLAEKRPAAMKKGIHPNYHFVNVQSERRHDLSDTHHLGRARSEDDARHRSHAPIRPGPAGSSN